MNIIKLRWIWYTLSSVFVGGSLICLAVFGLKQGIDFTGGTFLSVRFAGERPNPTDVARAL